MKKPKKIKLYVNEGDVSKTKALLSDNKIKFWNDWNHFQYDIASGIVTAVGIIILLVVGAALGL